MGDKTFKFASKKKMGRKGQAKTEIIMKREQILAIGSRVLRVAGTLDRAGSR